MPPFHFPYMFNNNLVHKFSSFPTYTSNPNLNIKKNVSYQSKSKYSVSNCEENIKADNSNFFFELFGIKLYLDDILIIGLLFFLYSEGVKDDELFISLILLLLN